MTEVNNRPNLDSPDGDFHRDTTVLSREALTNLAIALDRVTPAKPDDPTLTQPTQAEVKTVFIHAGDHLSEK